MSRIPTDKEIAAHLEGHTKGKNDLDHSDPRVMEAISDYQRRLYGLEIQRQLKIHKSIQAALTAKEKKIAAAKPSIEFIKSFQSGTRLYVIVKMDAPKHDDIISDYRVVYRVARSKGWNAYGRTYTKAELPQTLVLTLSRSGLYDIGVQGNAGGVRVYSNIVDSLGALEPKVVDKPKVPVKAVPKVKPTVKAKVVETKVKAVTDLKAKPLTRSSAYLTWSKVANIDGYQIVLRNGQHIANVNRNATSYTARNLISGNDYNFRIYPMTSNGLGPVSNNARAPLSEAPKAKSKPAAKTVTKPVYKTETQLEAQRKENARRQKEINETLKRANERIKNIQAYPPTATMRYVPYGNGNMVKIYFKISKLRIKLINKVRIVWRFKGDPRFNRTVGPVLEDHELPGEIMITMDSLKDKEYKVVAYSNYGQVYSKKTFVIN